MNTEGIAYIILEGTPLGNPNVTPQGLLEGTPGEIIKRTPGKILEELPKGILVGNPRGISDELLEGMLEGTPKAVLKKLLLQNPMDHLKVFPEEHPNISQGMPGLFPKETSRGTPEGTPGKNSQ